MVLIHFSSAGIQPEALLSHECTGAQIIYFRGTFASWKWCLTISKSLQGIGAVVPAFKKCFSKMYWV